ncbi:MAG: bifunctional methionine sulfoxide reductase B/A protein [Candidatus Rifleibacteriota bacterium]
MKKLLYFSIILLMISVIQYSRGEPAMNEKYNQLTPAEEYVIIKKGTERPFTGELLKNKAKGTYICRRCDKPLYRSEDKFESGCGWPSFDDEIPGAVKRIPDPDGHRVEIVCNNCGGHLGHVFEGEGFTPKNTRHCVNSISMKFVSAEENSTGQGALQKAIFAGGCFWGVEHLMQQVDGVKSVVSGYIGGNVDNPGYKLVCTGTTGHLEAVEISFDPAKTSFDTLARLFFEIHDFSQEDGQGPDIGPQYRSAVFYFDDQQKIESEKIIEELKQKGHKVATSLIAATKFWPAEDYHQDYYQKNGKAPYCHRRRKIF